MQLKSLIALSVVKPNGDFLFFFFLSLFMNETVSLRSVVIISNTKRAGLINIHRLKSAIHSGHHSDDDSPQMIFTCCETWDSQSNEKKYFFCRFYDSFFSLSILLWKIINWFSLFPHLAHKHIHTHTPSSLSLVLPLAFFFLHSVLNSFRNFHTILDAWKSHVLLTAAPNNQTKLIWITIQKQCITFVRCS